MKSFFLKIALTLITLLLIVLFFYLGFQYSRKNITPKEISPEIEEGVACTMEVKICPDGSAVGRQPPTCEFAPCP